MARRTAERVHRDTPPAEHSPADTLAADNHPLTKSLTVEITSATVRVWSPPHPVPCLPKIRHRISPPEPCPPASPHCCTPFASCSALAAILPRPRSSAPPASTSTPSRPASAPGGVHAILAHLQRGILRATALENVLLARAARGRDIGFAAPRERAAAAPAAPAGPPARHRPRRQPRGSARAAIPAGRLERSRTVHADLGGTRGAGAAPPARPHAGRYLP